MSTRYAPFRKVGSLFSLFVTSRLLGFIFYFMGTSIELVNSQITMSSLELAEISWRRHDVLLKSIDRMNEDLILMNKTPAVVGEYIAGNKIKAKLFILTIYQCELLALALDGIARIKVLDKLNELRLSPKSELSLAEMTLKVIEWQQAQIHELRGEVIHKKIQMNGAKWWHTKAKNQLKRALTVAEKKAQFYEKQAEENRRVFWWQYV